jgi:hypothetical protein
MIKYFPVILFIILGGTVQGQEVLSGRVIDLLSGQPVTGAGVQLKGTSFSTISNSLGEFILNRGEDTLSDGNISIAGHTIRWNLSASGVLNIWNVAGQSLVHNYKMHVGEGELVLDNLVDGIYLLRAVMTTGRTVQFKFVYFRSMVNGSSHFQAKVPGMPPKGSSVPDTIVITRDGFHRQEYAVTVSYADYKIMPLSCPASTDYLTEIIRAESFRLMEGPPLNPVFSEIRSVKIVYSIADDKIYYTNSTRYFIHYEFARDVLGYGKGHATFNQEQYTNNPNRTYILATLNYFTASGIYTLDFFAGDELTCSQIAGVYNKVVQTNFVGTKIRFLANNMKWTTCNNIPVITSDELYAGQNYQPLNPEQAYGYLKKFTLGELKTGYAGRHDITVLNGIPNDIAAVAGIITTEFQTPLSHINVLSHNRGAPNMALRDGWNNPLIEALTGKLVYLKVTLDTFTLREASLAEAQAFWAAREPTGVTKLQHDTTTQGLVSLETADIRSVKLIGGKAANFSELMKINVPGYGKLPLPEGAFAIPFYYYWQHMRDHSLDTFINRMLDESRFQTDFQYRKTQLIRLQDSIIALPIEPALLALVNARISEQEGYANIRFRSSTNSEDIKGFNGAGLYDSYTGIPGDPEKTIGRAIKRVWASLWNEAAFEEREYFKIDQTSVAMAVLVHRSFPNEAANGVVITENLYNQYNPGFIINVQAGEISITNPEGNYIPDQIIRYTFDDITEYITHSNAPGMQDITVLSEEEITELADYCMAIRNHYCNLNAACQTLDIEFKVDWINGERKIYIKQARLY